MKCPVCNSSSHYFWSEIDLYQPTFKVRKCAECLSLFQPPPQVDDSLLYDAGYYSGNNEYSYHDERENFKAKDIVYKARINNIQKFITHGTALDVGCSFGGFVKSLSQCFDAYGLDISQYAISEGNKWLATSESSKTMLFHGSLTDNIFTKNKKGFFSLITLIEVAEHLEDPQKHFQTAYNLLKPGGLLLLQTANFDGWQAILARHNYHYFMPGHLTYFTSFGLKQMLQRIGFSSFKEYYPVDFSLWAKLRKARRAYKSILEYRKLFSIGKYHLKSLMTSDGRPKTSSYVLYAFK